MIRSTRRKGEKVNHRAQMMKLQSVAVQTQIATKTVMSLSWKTPMKRLTRMDWIHEKKHSHCRWKDEHSQNPMLDWNTHRRMKWSLGMGIASLPDERWAKKAGWNPGLSIKHQTYRPVGRPKKKSVNSSSQRKLDDTTEQEVQHLLEETIITIGMSTEQILIKCPAKPITHAFLQFIDNDERETGQGRWRKISLQKDLDISNAASTQDTTYHSCRSKRTDWQDMYRSTDK